MQTTYALVLETEVLCVRAQVHNGRQQLVFSQATAWRMGWSENEAVTVGFSLRLLQPE